MLNKILSSEFQSQCIIFVEKFILYATITLSRKHVLTKLRPFIFADPIMSQILYCTDYVHQIDYIHSQKCYKNYATSTIMVFRIDSGFSKQTVSISSIWPQASKMLKF